MGESRTFRPLQLSNSPENPALLAGHRSPTHRTTSVALSPVSPTGWLLLILVVAAVLAAVTLRDRFSTSKSLGSFPRGPQPRKDALRDLGISEVRPAGTSTSGEQDDESATAASADPSPLPTSPETSADTMTLEETSPSEKPVPAETETFAPAADPALPEEPRARPARVRVRDDTSLWRSREDAAARLLDSLAVLCNGRTALFLVNNEEQNVEVVAVAGGSRLELRSQPLSACEIIGQANEKVVSVPADKRKALFYHPAPHVGIAEAKITRVTETPHLVLAVDVPAGGRFDNELTGLIGDYADVLKGMLAVDPELTFDSDSQKEPAEVAENGENEDARPASPDLFSQMDQESGDEEPTRLELLADELAAAREEKRPLAFALVAPRKADELLETHPDDIKGLEEEISGRLLNVEGTRRVDPFGDLLLGVFCDLQDTEFDAWAEAVAVETPVHIGAVVVTPDDDVDAEAVRDKAADAVHAAYEKGEACVVISIE